MIALKNIIIIIFLFVFSASFAQQPSHYFLGKDEFEGVQIYDVIQDNNQNYWFATDQGFYKYDNYKFERVECDEMKGLSAFGFVKDRNGIIYCYNLNNQIIKIENNFCSILYELKENERSADVFLSITSANNLLVLSKTVLLFNETGKQLKIKPLPTHYYGFPFKIKNGTVICHVSNTDSLLIVDETKTNIIHLNSDSEKIKGVLKFFKINNQTYAISTDEKQLYAFDENTLSIKKINISLFDNTKEFIRFYTENNQLWLAGNLSGIRYLNDVKVNALSNNIFSKYLISDVYKDKEGNMLLSTFNYGVIVIPNLNIPDVVSLPNEHSIITMQNDRDLGLLLGTTNGQLALFNENKYQIISNSGSKPLQAIYSQSGFPYLIFDDGKIKAYHKRTKKIIELDASSLKDVVFLDDKRAYFATNLGVFKIVFNDLGSINKEFINDLNIRSNSIDKELINKNIYVACSSGLLIFDNTNAVKHITNKGEAVFANDIVSYNDFIYVSTKNKEILKIKNGKVILSVIPKLNNELLEISKLQIHNDKIYTLSSKGVIVLNMEGKPVFQLNKAQGFSTNKIFDFEVVENDLWLCHSKGLQQFKLSELQNSIDTPSIQFSSIHVNDSSLVNFSDTVFSYNNRKIKFEISSPTLRNKETTKYYYKLIGYEDKWQVANYANNEIVYNALGSGNYTFVVKSENKGVFSAPISYSFFIRPPFYFSWWFISLCVLSFLGFVFLIYRWQLSIQRKKSQQINELNTSKLTAIKSQMNPHFIFNSLNSIQDLVLKGDVEKSYSYITTFSNLVRRTLNYSEKDFIDFDQEIKLLEFYLSLEKLRFKNDFNYKIDTNEVDDIMIPPLLIQPFIENSLIHGLLHKEGQKNLIIKFELNENLICTIEDNGVGREKAKAIKLRQRSEHESFSGKAIHKRFEILSDVFKGNFGYHYCDLYSNGEPLGTRVTLIIPVKHKF